MILTGRSPAPRFLFAPAFGDGVGGGHMMRCLALAAALAERGAETIFVAPSEAFSTIRRFAPSSVLMVERAPTLSIQCAELAPDVVVVDDYALGAADETPLRGDARLIVAIDDLANRAHDADILVDANYGRSAADYDEWIGPRTTALLGPRFALLRPAFAQAEPISSPVRRRIERVFISFGLSDPDRVALRAVTAIRALLPEAHLDVALAGHVDSLLGLRTLAGSDSRLSLHIEATDIAPIMRQADVAVGAGGGATWERCRLGMPTVAVVIADNQAPAVSALHRDGVVLALDGREPGWEKSLAECVELISAPALREDLRRRSMAVCDGQGAGRVADMLMARRG